MGPHSGFEAHLYRLEIAGLLCWLVKDLSWVLLLPWVTFPAALIALCLETHSLWVRRGVDTAAEYGHRVAVLLWLLGNSCWMVAELAFEASPEFGRQFPWYHGPVLGVQPHDVSVLVGVAQGCFLLGLLVLMSMYGWWVVGLLRGRWQPLDDSETEGVKAADREEEKLHGGQRGALVAGLVTQSVYEYLFIGPWIAKDFFWTLELFYCAVPLGLAAAALTIDCIRRFGGAVPIAEFGWVVANIVWIAAELALEDAYQWPRWMAATILFADCLLISAALWGACRPRASAHGEPTEDTYLFGRAASARAPEG